MGNFLAVTAIAIYIAATAMTVVACFIERKRLIIVSLILGVVSLLPAFTGVLYETVSAKQMLREVLQKKTDAQMEVLQEEESESSVDSGYAVTPLITYMGNTCTNGRAYFLDHNNRKVFIYRPECRL